MEYTNLRISDAMRKINREIFLPDIQREFVWDRGRMENLFDSIM